MATQRGCVASWRREIIVMPIAVTGIIAIEEMM